MFTKLKDVPAKRRFVLIGGALALIAITSYLALKPAPVEEAMTADLPLVTVKNVTDIDYANTFEVVGTVAAVSEARLQTEAAGRITAVNVEIGDQVGAGAVVATIENRAESAALLQAQGAYEAALAGAAASNVSVSQARSQVSAAENSAAGAIRSAYTNVSNGFYTLIDDLYGNPETTLPGVRVSSSKSQFLNAERVAFQDILPTWQQSAAAASDPQTIDSSIDFARTSTVRAIGVVDGFIFAFNGRDTDTLQDKSVATWITELNALRTTLNASLTSLDAAAAGLSASRDALAQAQLAGTGGEVSAANAQVKIALGSLRAAQANYEKTIVRSPISGVVNALYLKAGDYAAPSQPAAIIANNNGLEIATAVSLEDSETLAVGDSVTIDGSSYGVITAIGGAVDPTTGKVALKVSVDEGSKLENGATVSLSFSEGKPEAAVETEIVIPLAALKMTGSGPVVFFVSAENTLVANPVILGAIRGDSVVIREGLTQLDAIVMDARGLKAGQTVSIIAN